MDVLQAIILGIVQGITEWLPVSSSGHLVIFQKLLDIKVDLMFDIVLHFASLLIILFVFRKRISEIMTFKSNLALPIIIGTIPIAFVGYFLHDIIESMFSSLILVALALIITGFMLLMTKNVLRKNNLSKSKAFIIGIAQAFALIPGISRSGSTISAGLLLNIKAKQTAEFSFLLAVPAIAGALLLEATKTAIVINTQVIIGFLAALITGYLSLSLLLKIISRNKFHCFAYYTIPLGILLIVYSLL